MTTLQHIAPYFATVAAAVGLGIAFQWALVERVLAATGHDESGAGAGGEEENSDHGGQG